MLDQSGRGIAPVPQWAAGRQAPDRPEVQHSRRWNEDVANQYKLLKV